MTDWQKSSMSGNSNQCVEVRTAGGRIEIRESDTPESVVTTTRESFGRWLARVKRGEFDHPTP
ncbi:hypothetical protein GCM10009639_51100 [Kitasatospora putterlickiae]|uniref:DUF397 domain-containing protein n=1 Tax=Kitasatospora putterlickiae TaxID=221725 RepID=A0ABP4J0X3_9ACTN